LIDDRSSIEQHTPITPQKKKKNGGLSSPFKPFDILCYKEPFGTTKLVEDSANKKIRAISEISSSLFPASAFCELAVRTT